jgi:uncharacterized protein DUF4232
VTALAAGGGTVALASTAGAAAAPAGASVTRCLEASLVTGLYGYEHDHYDGKGQGGFILTLTNNGATPCSLSGYPGLGLEDAQHHVVRSHTHWGSTYFAHDAFNHATIKIPNGVGLVSTRDLDVTAMARHTHWKGSGPSCC